MVLENGDTRSYTLSTLNQVYGAVENGAPGFQKQSHLLARKTLGSKIQAESGLIALEWVDVLDDEVWR
ncbi:hypothetical protein MARHY3580 [Marinobacter nauticus ATCC 49840]|nr:hypothetical protein MARHY3580 [Marinobacter nauticus ATCC 49840]